MPSEDQIETDEPRDADAEARRRVALAQIRQYPDPVLRLPAREVAAFDADLLRLVERMTGLMRDANGVGLAATQVGVLRRVVVFQTGGDEEATALVNPEITARSSETDVDDEGCLSLQGVLVPVERHISLTVDGSDAHGEPLRLELESLRARVVQHELDHLDGVLILQRTDGDSRREALAQLRPDPLLR